MAYHGLKGGTEGRDQPSAMRDSRLVAASTRKALPSCKDWGWARRPAFLHLICSFFPRSLKLQLLVVKLGLRLAPVSRQIHWWQGMGHTVFYTVGYLDTVRDHPFRVVLTVRILSSRNPRRRWGQDEFGFSMDQIYQRRAKC